MTKTIDIPSYQDGLSSLIQQLTQILPADKLTIFNHDARQLGLSYPSPLKLAVGNKAPPFALPNATGKMVSLSDLLQHGAVVLTFYRGIWCPYCNLQLKSYQQILPLINETGAQLVAISPMTPDHSLQMLNSNTLEFEVLSDVGNRVARQYTQVIVNPQTSIHAMQELGYDFYQFYGDTTAELPVPATFVIARDGTIVFASSNGGDYRQRVEPRIILDALEQ